MSNISKRIDAWTIEVCILPTIRFFGWLRRSNRDFLNGYAKPRLSICKLMNFLNGANQPDLKKNNKINKHWRFCKLSPGVVHSGISWNKIGYVQSPTRQVPRKKIQWPVFHHFYFKVFFVIFFYFCSRLCGFSRWLNESAIRLSMFRSISNIPDIHRMMRPVQDSRPI